MKSRQYYLIFLKRTLGFIVYFIPSDEREVKIQNSGKILKQQMNFLPIMFLKSKHHFLKGKA